MTIPIETVQTAYPNITGLTWTQVDTDYFYAAASARVEIDMNGVSDALKIVGICYYIASLHQGSSAASSIGITSEGLGDYSYSKTASTSLDCWLDRYKSLLSDSADDPVVAQTSAFTGIENDDVPIWLRLDRWC